MIDRTYAYVVSGIGLVLLVAGLLKFVPGLTGAGGGLLFLGVVLYGLSFVPRPAEPPDPESMSFPRRFAGLFFEPARVFRDLRTYPHWLAALAVIVLFNFAYSVAFQRVLTPERIHGFTYDKLTENGWVPPEMAEQQKQEQIEQAKSTVGVVGAAVNAFVGAFCVLAALAGLALLLVMLFGGRINFWQSLAVLAHAWLPVTVIAQTLNLVLLSVKDPDDIHPALGQGGLLADNLGALFSPAEHPVLYAAAGAVGVLALYRVWLTATGLRHGGESVSSVTAWGVSITFWVVGLLLAVIGSALFGNFMA